MQKTKISTIKKRFGANYNKETNCIDFTLFSKNATDVFLCIFKKPTGENEHIRKKMKKNGNVFSCSIPYTESPVFYGFRVFGNNFVYDKNFNLNSNIGFKTFVDEYGNRFNPNKIALDPYGLEISHIPENKDWQRVNKDNYFLDNSKTAPKSVFVKLDDVEIPLVSPRPFKDEIIGEVHLKSLTMLSDFKEKGTYIGASRFAKNLKDLGITMVEFLPLHEFDMQDNYWGYMPLSYFALQRKYCYNKDYGSTIVEFRNLIKAFHENNLKVCMDVVYNHTGEGRIFDNVDDVNLMSYALIDNSTYYKISNNYYTNYSGCNNDFNVANSEVQDFIIDSLVYFHNLGVDAFRFDLAAELLDTDNSASVNYDKTNSFVSKIKDMLMKRSVKVNSFDDVNDGITLIAEPWTCNGFCCYQLGNFPNYFYEWNDISRNTIRANSVRVYETDPLGLRNLIEGTPFVYGDNSRSINYITSHDGFSLNDLNSYDRKSEKTQGGSDYEMSSSFMGDVQKQENAIRKEIALLILSKGVLMTPIEDIYCHSKQGVNNSYNFDNEINYIDFLPCFDETKREYRIFNYWLNMFKFRKKHKILTDEKYNKKIKFYAPNGNVIPYENNGYWQNNHSNFFAYKTDDCDDLIYVAISKSDFEIDINVPTSDKNAYLITDTTKSDVDPEGVLIKDGSYKLKPHSLVIFEIR